MTGGNPLTGLEVWLIGTPAELDAAARALTSIGHVLHHTGRTALADNDTGRYSTYAWLHVTATADHPVPANRPATLPNLTA